MEDRRNLAYPDLIEQSGICPVAEDHYLVELRQSYKTPKPVPAVDETELVTASSLKGHGAAAASDVEETVAATVEPAASEPVEKLTVGETKTLYQRAKDVRERQAKGENGPIKVSSLEAGKRPAADDEDDKEGYGATRKPKKASKRTALLLGSVSFA